MIADSSGQPLAGAQVQRLRIRFVLPIIRIPWLWLTMMCIVVGILSQLGVVHL